MARKAGIRGGAASIKKQIQRTTDKYLAAKAKLITNYTAHEVADALTEQSQQAFDVGLRADGGKRPKGKNGKVLDLEDTGYLRRNIGYKYRGSKVLAKRGLKRYVYVNAAKYGTLLLPGRKLPPDIDRTVSEAAERAARDLGLKK